MELLIAKLEFTAIMLRVREEVTADNADPKLGVAGVILALKFVQDTPVLHDDADTRAFVRKWVQSPGLLNGPVRTAMEMLGIDVPALHALAQ